MDNKTINEINDFIDKLPTREEVSSMRTFMKNSVEKFSHDNTNFKKDFKDHLAIIRRYDEVISEKANKHTIV